MSEFDNPRTIICGDWNLVLDINLDCENYLHVNNPLARNSVHGICRDLDLVDPWRVQNESARGYT